MKLTLLKTKLHGVSEAEVRSHVSNLVCLDADNQVAYKRNAIPSQAA